MAKKSRREKEIVLLVLIPLLLCVATFFFLFSRQKNPLQADIISTTAPGQLPNVVTAPSQRPTPSLTPANTAAKLQKSELYPTRSDALLVNPMVGYAPSADYSEIVKDNTLVYVDVTWREWEPQKGTFDYKSLEQQNHLNEWSAKGKRVVFRFVCDIPGTKSHMDIPDWLYQEINKDGDWYDTDYGKGFSPNYSNEILIKEHRNAIKALGERYGGDDFFCFIELGSLGHWGEWHTKYDDNIRRMPDENVRLQYILPYVEYFPNAMLLMRRPFAPAKQYNMGLFNDMTGLQKDTLVWLDWIRNGGVYGETEEPNALVPMPEAWKTAPIGGEFTSDIPMSKMLVEDVEKTKQLIASSHMSFIGPMCPASKPDTSAGFVQGSKSVLAVLGYRLRIDKATLYYSVNQPDDLKVVLDWTNDGIAPLYKNWDVNLYLFNAKGEQVVKCKAEFDPRRVVDDSIVQSTTVLPTRNLPAGNYTVGIAIIDPLTKKPAIEFAMENTRKDKIYILGQWDNE